MIRVLAHRVLFDGKAYPLSVVEISDDGRSVNITPFERETPNTIFIPGTIEITLTPASTYQITKAE